MIHELLLRHKWVLQNRLVVERMQQDYVCTDHLVTLQYRCTIQIHLQVWGDGQVQVSWVTGAAVYGPSITPRKSDPTPCHARYWLVTAHHRTERKQVRASGERYFYNHRFEGAWNYSSGMIHHAVMDGLRPRQQYAYQVCVAVRIRDHVPAYLLLCILLCATCVSPNLQTTPPQVSGHHAHHVVWSDVHTFTTPPVRGDAAAPLVLGFMADVGQTYNSSDTMQHMQEDAPDVVVHVGDISYAGVLVGVLVCICTQRVCVICTLHHCNIQCGETSSSVSLSHTAQHHYHTQYHYHTPHSITHNTLPPTRR